NIDASSITHAPSLGEACLPLLRRIVWWFAWPTVRCSAIGHPFRRAHDGVSPQRGTVNRSVQARAGPRHRANRRRGAEETRARSGGGVERRVHERVRGRVLSPRNGAHAPAAEAG